MVGTRRFELRSTGFLMLQKLVIGIGLSKPVLLDWISGACDDSLVTPCPLMCDIYALL